MPARPRLLPAAAVVSAVLIALLLGVNVASYHRTRTVAYGTGPSVFTAGAGRGGGLLYVGRASSDEAVVGMIGLNWWEWPGTPTPFLQDQFQVLGFSYVSSATPLYRDWSVTFPLWAPMLPPAVPPALWWHRRRRAARRGFPVGPA